jgi:hypothetical protein
MQGRAIRGGSKAFVWDGITRSETLTPVAAAVRRRPPTGPEPPELLAPARGERAFDVRGGEGRNAPGVLLVP